MAIQSVNATAVPVPSTLADLWSLTKPGLSSLVVATMAGAMWLAPGSLSLGHKLLALLATAMTVGAANAFNCYLERDRDRLMARTQNRPLPAGRMEPRVALVFGASLAIAALPMLALAANGLTAFLGLLALVSYVAAYTPLKARSDAAMLVGGIPGALPPLMGWTAVTGRIDLGGAALFGILFFWQLPHFLAIALFRKAEYQRAGLKSVPLERGDGVARAQLFLYTLALVAVSILPYCLHIVAWPYVLIAGALGVMFLVRAAQGWLADLGGAWARRTFFFSLVYLPALFTALLLMRVG